MQQVEKRGDCECVRWAYNTYNAFLWAGKQWQKLPAPQWPPLHYL